MSARARSGVIALSGKSTSGNNIRFLNIFRPHQQCRHNCRQGQEPRDHEEVLEHGDAGFYQDGLGLRIVRSQTHVSSQAVEALYAQADRAASPSASPTIRDAVTDYTVAVANTVTQITFEGTPHRDGTVAYQNTDRTTLTDADTVADGQQVGHPSVDDKRINVVVTHTDSGMTTTQTYGVLVSRAVSWTMYNLGIYKGHTGGVK